MPAKFPPIDAVVTLRSFPHRETPFKVRGHDGADNAGRPMLVAEALVTDDKFTAGERRWFSPGQTAEYAD